MDNIIIRSGARVAKKQNTVIREGLAGDTELTLFDLFMHDARNLQILLDAAAYVSPRYLPSSSPLMPPSDKEWKLPSDDDSFLESPTIDTGSLRPIHNCLAYLLRPTRRHTKLLGRPKDLLFVSSPEPTTKPYCLHFSGDYTCNLPAPSWSV